CMYRADFSGYEKCEEEEKARKRAEILAEQNADGEENVPPTAAAPDDSASAAADEEWNTVAETTVTGSSALKCETKILAGLFRARCGANDLETPKSVTLVRGS